MSRYSNRIFKWADGSDSWAIYETHLGCQVRERVITEADGSQRLDVVLGGRPPVLETVRYSEIAGKNWS